MSQNHFSLDQTVFWTSTQRKQGVWDHLELESFFLGNVPVFVFINEEGFGGEGLTEGALLNWCWPMSELSVKLHREHHTSTLSPGLPLTSMNLPSSTGFQHHCFWPTNALTQKNRPSNYKVSRWRTDSLTWQQKKKIFPFSTKFLTLNEWIPSHTPILSFFNTSTLKGHAWWPWPPTSELQVLVFCLTCLTSTWKQIVSTLHTVLFIERSHLKNKKMTMKYVYFRVSVNIFDSWTSTKCCHSLNWGWSVMVTDLPRWVIFIAAGTLCLVPPSQCDWIQQDLSQPFHYLDLRFLLSH